MKIWRVEKLAFMSNPEFVGYENSPASPQLGRVVHDARGNTIGDRIIEVAVLAQISVDEGLGKPVDPLSLDPEPKTEPARNWCDAPPNRP